MVKITEEMHKHYKQQMRVLEIETDRRIINAVNKQTNKAVFPLDQTDALFYDLKELYERNGYKVVPVGIIGGVRQRDYYIVW